MSHHASEKLANARGIDPYVMLAGAKLARLLMDAQGRVHVSGAVTDANKRGALIRQAQALLEDREALDFWCGLAGAETEVIVAALQRALRTRQATEEDRCPPMPSR